MRFSTRNRNWLICALLFLLEIPLFAQSSLQSQIDAILSHPYFEYANVSLSVYDIETSTQIIDHRSKKTLVPASSLKLLSSFMALENFGEDFQFETIISHDGSIGKDGTLHGNLYIEGSGDPCLGFDRIDGSMNLSRLVEKIKNEVLNYGIKCIDGEIVADESIFNSYPISPSWQWNDLGNYYASGAWGINVHENTYYIYFDQRDVIGSSPNIKFHEPRIPGIQFSNEVLVDSAHTGDNAYIFGGPYDYYKRISGTIPKGKKLFRIKGAMPDPPLFLIQQIENALAKENVDCHSLNTQFRPKPTKGRKTIFSIKSPSLAKIVKATNAESLNLHAEALFKLISLDKSKHASGSKAIHQIESQLKAFGINVEGMHLEDGSGLSARNLISSETLAQFIQSLYKKHDKTYLTAYIPQVGKDGTVKNLTIDNSMENKLWLKSGSMNHIISYTGLIEQQNGKDLSFSIIVNGFHKKHSDMRSLISKILKTLYYYN